MRSRILFLLVLLACVSVVLAPTCSSEKLCVTVEGTVDITSTSITAKGNLQNSSGIDVVVGFHYWQTDVYLWEQNPTSVALPDVMTKTGDFTYTLENLNPGTTYGFKPWARRNEQGAKPLFGDTIQVTTLGGENTPPTLVTGAADNITASSATLHVEVVTVGTASSLYVEIQLRMPDGSTVIYPVAGTVQAPGDFSVEVSGLTPDTTYYYKAAGSSVSVVVPTGEEKSFKTKTAQLTW